MAKLHFRYASMNAGKSTQALQVVFNYEEGGHVVRCFTATIDNRYGGSGIITSRIGLSRVAEPFSGSTNFYELLKLDHVGVSCILVDEAQFVTKDQAHQLHRAAHEFDLPVMCFGLRTDFKGEPFIGSAHLLSLADDIQEVKSICACGHKATMNIRLDSDGLRVREGDSILIGGNERYRQVCAKCFYTT